MPSGSFRPVPPRALIISLAALAVPVIGVFAFPDWVQEEQGTLIWLTSLVPSFLLAYYRGLRGVAVALAGAMAVLSLTQVVVLLLDQPAPNWQFLLAVVATYIVICVGLAVFAEILHRERRAAEALALTDGLTGLPNRRHAELTLDAQFAAADRGRSVVVVLFDLDRFKLVNDRHGHDTGDAALRVFADALKRNTRRMDLSARFGGEEFISVLGDIEQADALRFANRVREGIKAHAFPWGHLTVSAGVAAYDDAMATHELLVAAADRALYAAKEAGRDRVAVAQPFVPGGVAPVVAGPSARSGGGDERILVIDDDLAMLGFVGRVLKRAGYRVEETDDPETVITRYRDGQTTIDLLITDIMMPRMSGPTIVERVSRSRPGLRVVYLSGYLQREVSISGLPGATIGLVGKPLDPTELLATVRRGLDQQ